MGIIDIMFDHPPPDPIFGKPAVSFLGHVAALGSWLGSLVGLLPALAALVGVIYYTIQIFESATVQKWLDARRMRRKARRVARLKAEQKVLVAELEALEVVREARAVADDKVARASHEAATQLATETAQAKITSTRTDAAPAARS